MLSLSKNVSKISWTSSVVFLSKSFSKSGTVSNNSAQRSSPPTASSPTPPDAVLEVRPIPGRGIGVVALVDVPSGTRLLAEAPLTLEGPGLPPIEESVAQLEEKLWAAEEKLLAVRAARQEAEHGPSKPKEAGRLAPALAAGC